MSPVKPPMLNKLTIPGFSSDPIRVERTAALNAKAALDNAAARVVNAKASLEATGKRRADIERQRMELVSENGRNADEMEAAIQAHDRAIVANQAASNALNKASIAATGRAA